MTGCSLGIDTSNYTTSAAVYAQGGIVQAKKLLPVGQGAIGLRQSDAVFAHIKQLGDVLEEILAAGPCPLEAVGVSASPRDEADSYMPCFLVGELVGRSIALAKGVPFHRFSHQAGHIAAALYATDSLALLGRPFLAFHVSGGTTECLRVEPDKEKVLSICKVAGTLDLNAGQVVDRVGALLDLPFPAGPALETLAGRSDKRFGAKPAFKGMDCCLSGLENQCAKRLAQGEPPQDVARFCLEAIGRVILTMTELVCARHPGLPLVYAGGVMSNRQIRRQVEEHFDCRFAPPAFSADNAAGIAVLCSLRQARLGGKEETLC